MLKSIVVQAERARARDVTKRYATAWGARTLRLRVTSAAWWATAVDAVGRAQRQRQRGPAPESVRVAFTPFPRPRAAQLTEPRYRCFGGGNRHPARPKDALEDAELETRAAAETLPATVDAYRNHPL